MSSSCVVTCHRRMTEVKRQDALSDGTPRQAAACGPLSHLPLDEFNGDGVVVGDGHGGGCAGGGGGGDGHGGGAGAGGGVESRASLGFIANNTLFPAAARFTLSDVTPSADDACRRTRTNPAMLLYEMLKDTNAVAANPRRGRLTRGRGQ